MNNTQDGRSHEIRGYDPEAREFASKTDTRLSSHELICAERYTALNIGHANLGGKINRIEYMLYFLIGLLLVGDGTVLELIKRFANLK